jgi:hypothetical protein
VVWTEVNGVSIQGEDRKKRRADLVWGKEVQGECRGKWSPDEREISLLSNYPGKTDTKAISTGKGIRVIFVMGIFISDFEFTLTITV